MSSDAGGGTDPAGAASRTHCATVEHGKGVLMQALGVDEGKASVVLAMYASVYRVSVASLAEGLIDAAAHDDGHAGFATEAGVHRLLDECARRASGD